MKPILIIRVPKDAVEHIPELKSKLYRSFRQYKVKVIFDNDKQVGFNLSVINTTISADEILEKQILKIVPEVQFEKYALKPLQWRYSSNSLLDLIGKVLKARVKNFFYFGKFVD